MALHSPCSVLSINIFFCNILFLVLMGPQWPVGAFQQVLVVKNLPTIAGDVRDAGSMPGSGRCPAGGHCNPLQYSCLENPMDRRVWWPTVYRVAKSQTWLKRLSTHTRPKQSLKDVSDRVSVFISISIYAVILFIWLDLLDSLSLFLFAVYDITEME